MQGHVRKRTHRTKTGKSMFSRQLAVTERGDSVFGDRAPSSARAVWVNDAAVDVGPSADEPVSVDAVGVVPDKGFVDSEVDKRSKDDCCGCFSVDVGIVVGDAFSNDPVGGVDGAVVDPLPLLGEVIKVA